MGNGQIEERSERVMRRKEVDGKQMTNKERKKMEMERSRIRRERGWRERGRKGREENIFRNGSREGARDREKGRSKQRWPCCRAIIAPVLRTRALDALHYAENPGAWRAGGRAEELAVEGADCARRGRGEGRPTL